MNQTSLIAALFFPGKGTVTVNGITGKLVSITRADDSGKRFKVLLVNCKQNEKSYPDIFLDVNF